MGQCCQFRKKHQSDPLVVNRPFHMDSTKRFLKIHDRPIIGIMAVMADPPERGAFQLPANYVKSVEASGARVVSVLPGQQEIYYRRMFERLNGLLIPGGAGSPLGFQKPVTAAVSLFYRWSISAYENGDYWPIWGTCLGLEMLLDITEGMSGKLLARCSMPHGSFPLEITEEAKESRMITSLPKDLFEVISKDPVFPHLHAYCIPLTRFHEKHLNDFYLLVGTNHDRHGLEYVSAIEARNGYPIYAVMGHPEKAVYSWTKHFEFDHSMTSIRFSQHWMNFFVQECCKNRHHFTNLKEEQAALIYNYSSIYISKDEPHSTADQCYFFD